MEKAYAKAYGSYNVIVSGQPKDALRDLTGAPSYDVVHKDVKDREQFWNKIVDADRKDWIIACATHST